MKTKTFKITLVIFLVFGMMLTSVVARPKYRKTTRIIKTYLVAEHPECENIPDENWFVSISKSKGSTYLQVEGEYRNYYFLWLGYIRHNKIVQYDYVFFEEEEQ